MRAFAVLTEELESRLADADRVDALARWLRAVGRDAGALGGEWLVAGLKPARPPRLTQAALAEAARTLAIERGSVPWLFDTGLEASDELAEAIALLLPWPDDAFRPALAEWLARWTAASAEPPETRAAAVATAIAGLDDALARRWAVRAACGLVKPVVDAWQWQRAWARAFELDERAVAWHWHRSRDALRAPALDAALPHPSHAAPLAEAAAHRHDELLVAWRRGELRAEPRWSGWRVQVVRRGDDVAVWRRGAGLLNASVPPEWLAPEAWPEAAAIEALLLAWHAGRIATLADALAPRRRGSADRPTLHLALVEWTARAASRRDDLLVRWPEPDLDAASLPAIFTMPTLPAPGDVHGLQQHADATRAHGWSGLVLRHRDSPAAWTVRAGLHRIRAVLQYVPSEVLAAHPAAARALAFVACGFALWSRAPISEDEQGAAMTAAMSGQFLPSPADAPGLAALRLLPLARLPIALPGDELLRLHTWLRAHAGQRFGGVHAVAPVLVFELGFAEARPSARHRIGATLAGARVLRWCHDAPAGGAQLAADLFPG